MNSFLLAALFGSLVIQLVSSQGSRTTWAANQSPGLEGVPVSLLAVPGNAPGLRIMYNALKADKRILELLKAGVLSPLSNSIVLMPGSKTKVKTTKTTVVETMTSESGMQEDKTTTLIDSTIQQNALPESNVLPEENGQGPVLNMDLLNERFSRLNMIPNEQMNMNPSTNMITNDNKETNMISNTNMLTNDMTKSDFPMTNNGQSGQIPQLSLDIIKKRLQALNLLRSDLPKVRPPQREPLQAPPLPKVTYRPDPKPFQKSADASLIKNSIEKQEQMTPRSSPIKSFDTVAKTVVEKPAAKPTNVSTAVNYDSKALTDTLLVMLKTMHMIQTYIKDSLATTTTVATTTNPTTSRPITTTPRPTTTTTRTTTTTPRPTTTLPTTTLLSTFPTTVPATTTEAMPTIDYFFGMFPANEMETTTEVYDMVTSADTTLYLNSTWNPEILDLILSFRAAITVVNKGEPAATVKAEIKPALPTVIPTKQQETVKPLSVSNVATTKRFDRPTEPVQTIPPLTSKQEPTASASGEARLNTRRAGTNVPEVAMRSLQTKSAAPSEGPMTPPPLDFTEYQNNMAIAQINAAPTENQAAYAAAAVYSPVLDMSDAVQSALETKVQHLRTPANWQHHVPPPLPFNFDPMYLVLGAFYKTLNRNAPQVKATGFGPAASPPMGMGPAMGPDPAAIGPGPAAMGPPTSIRRGGRPGPPGFGPGGMYMSFEPTQWEVDTAVYEITAAKTQAAAVKAAAGVHRIGLDLPDIVHSTLQEKVARLRAPKGNRRGPPRPPVNVVNLVMRAHQEMMQVQLAKAKADASRAALQAAKAAKKAKKAATATTLRPRPPPRRKQTAGPPPTRPPPPPPKRPAPPPPNRPAPPPNRPAPPQPNRPAGPPPTWPARKRKQPVKIQQTWSTSPTSKRPAPPVPAWPSTPPPPTSKNPQGDFMSSFIERRRQHRRPPPVPKLFTRPPPMQFTQPPPAPLLLNNAPVTNHPPPHINQEATNMPNDPFFSEQTFRPLPKVDAYRPPSNVPTPPNINWKIKPSKTKSMPIAETAVQNQPSAIPIASSGQSASSYNPPSALPGAFNPEPPQYNPAPMTFPKQNLPPAPKRAKPMRKMSLFPKRDSGRASDIPGEVLSSEMIIRTRDPITSSTRPTKPTPSPQEKMMFNRYPGLYENRAQLRAAARPPRAPKRRAVSTNAAMQMPPRPPPSHQMLPAMPFMQEVVQTPVISIPEYATTKVEPKVVQQSKLWSPLGNLGSNINEILKFSIGGPAESVAIPTVQPPPTTTTVAPTTLSITTTIPTTAAPTAAPTTKKVIVEKVRKAPKRKKLVPVRPAESKPIGISGGKPIPKPKINNGSDKLNQLQGLLEGISPSQLQTLVGAMRRNNLIKAKANEGKPRRPAPKPEPLPQPKPIFIPPPPGSENTGPSREIRGGAGIATGPQGARQGPFGPPNRDYGPPQGNRGPPPPGWARGPGGPPRGGPGGPMRGGPPGPRRGGPPGGIDLNNPQVARFIRVMEKRRKKMLSGQSPAGGAANAVAAGGEAPEPGEGGAAGLLANPMMMSMMMGNQGGQAGGPNAALASLLGAGGNPLAALLGGGGAGGAGLGGGNQAKVMANNGAEGAAGGKNGNRMEMIKMLANSGAAGGATGEQTGPQMELMKLMANQGAGGANGGQNGNRMELMKLMANGEAGPTAGGQNVNQMVLMKMLANGGTGGALGGQNGGQVDLMSMMANSAGGAQSGQSGGQMDLMSMMANSAGGAQSGQSGGQMDLMTLMANSGAGGAQGGQSGGQMDLMTMLVNNGAGGAQGGQSGDPMAMMGGLGGMSGLSGFSGGGGGAGAGAEGGGMNQQLMAALMGQGGGAGAGGLGGLAQMMGGGSGGFGGLGGLGAAMLNPDGPGAMGGLGGMGGMGGMGGLGGFGGGLGGMFGGLGM